MEKKLKNKKNDTKDLEDKLPKKTKKFVKNIIMESGYSAAIADRLVSEIENGKKQKKVYLVMDQYHGNAIVKAVRSTHELAEEYRKANDEFGTSWIVPWSVDEEPSKEVRDEQYSNLLEDQLKELVKDEKLRNSSKEFLDGYKLGFEDGLKKGKTE